MNKKDKAHIASLSLATTLIIGLVNTGSAVIAYSFFAQTRPKKIEALQPLTEVVIQQTKTDSQTPTPNEQPANSANQPASRPQRTTPSLSANLSPSTPVRAAQAPIVIGSQPLPTQVITKPDGKVEYKWCSGKNPALVDGVCEAILSIASNPTASNPHLGPKTLQSLALLPSNSTLTMDESSWNANGSSAGTMNITMHTSDYGDVKLSLKLEKTNDIWVVTDGQIAS